MLVQRIYGKEDTPLLFGFFLILYLRHISKTSHVYRIFNFAPFFFMKEKHITFQKTGITFQNDRRRTFHALCTRQRAKIENSKNMEGIRNVSRYRIKQKIEITFDKRSAPLNVAVQLSFRYEILHVAEMPKDL